eukprot:CFRG4412T1
MESNRSEADRCVQIAIKCLNDVNFEKAKRFLQKADNMYPSEKAKELLVQVQRKEREFKETPSQKESASASHNNSHAHKRSTSSGASSSTTRPEVQKATGKPNDAKKIYTAEQAAEVRKIKSCRGYYEVLGVEKSATESQIKKSYRKRALTFHPDKNQAPGADEAFKSISKAFQVLSDKNLRQQYDLYGEEGANRAAQQGGRGGGMSGPYGQAFTPEEIFQMFFNGVRPEDLRRAGGGQRQQNHFRTYQFGGGRTQGGGQQTSGGLSFMHLLPFIIMFILSMMSGSSDIRAFDLRQSSDHPLPRRTTQHEVPYYVRRNFNQEFQGKPRELYRMEESVEKEWLVQTQNRCNAEKYNMKRNLDAAKYYNDEKRLQRVKSQKLPYCEQLEAFKQNGLGDLLSGNKGKEQVRSVPR